MTRPQPLSNTFIVPQPLPAAPKSAREANPFVTVPAQIGADDKLEPHWLHAIDAATD